MTPLPTDPIDPREAGFTRRIRDLSEHAIVPIDAAAIARTVAEANPRRRFGWLRGASASGGRLGWIVVAGLLAVAAIGGLALGSGGRQSAVVSPSATPSTAATTSSTAPAIVATPVPTSQPILACTPSDITARVIDWTGAAGQRVASLEATNTGAVACLFPTVTRPQLVDGTGAILIDGTTTTGGTRIKVDPGARLTTMAEDGNYCGPTPVAPITVAFLLSGGQRVIAAPVSPTDTTGLAPCMGSGSPADITMHAWRP
jgi:hypothetical protein